MRIFVTGASGWIGSATVAELLAGGHEVVGLARSDASADELTAAGVTVRRGTLDDLDLLRATAADSDGVIHLAFKHDIAFSGDYAGAADADHQAIQAFGDALAGTDRPLAIASGTLGIAPGRVATEHDGHDLLGEAPEAVVGPARRLANAELTLGFAERGVRSCVVRLAPTNHGDGDNGFLATLVAVARAQGVAGFVGDGSSRWPAVHRLDTAHLFRLAVERAPAGSTLHAVAEEGVPTREIAEAIGRGLDLPVAAIPEAEADEHFGFLARFIGVDAPASSELTRELLGWEPVQAGLIEDLDQGHYFGR